MHTYTKRTEGKANDYDDDDNNNNNNNNNQNNNNSQRNRRQGQNLKGCTEALICSAQEQALRTNYVKFHIDKTGESTLCRT